MKKYTTLFLVMIWSCCFIFSAKAQEEEKTGQEEAAPATQDVNADYAAPSFWQRVRFGGNFSLGFGNVFNITLAPNAIYYFSPRAGAGIGFNGIYAGQKDVYAATVLGGSVIGVFNPIREIQLSSEFEMLNVNRNFKDAYEAAGYEDENYWYPALFFGIGYNPGFMVIGLRYDILYDESKSIYGSAFMPFIRLSF